MFSENKVNPAKFYSYRRKRAIIKTDMGPLSDRKVGETFLVDMVDMGREMFEEGAILNLLKEIWVTPIWKGSIKEDPLDYSPISITNHLKKALEQVARKQLVDFLT